jgi:hypothetical protein
VTKLDQQDRAAAAALFALYEKTAQNKPGRGRPSAHSWQAVAAQLGYTTGVIHAVAHGKKRAPNRLLCALGLPPRTVPVQPCPHCGKPPLRKRGCACQDAGRPKRRRLAPPLVRLVAGLLASGHLEIKA